MNYVAALFGGFLVGIGALIGAYVARLILLRTPMTTKSNIQTKSSMDLARQGAVHMGLAKPPSNQLRTDVVRALTTAGYSKVEASESVDACKGSECSTLESWTRAALRNLAMKDAAEDHRRFKVSLVSEGREGRGTGPA